ncbi:cytochrome c3 family protein [bacterium]|nr:cytochrome c3 family protein [bacterium]MBU1676230.1 cytochrome c3 family protein [bacterium]
MDFRKYLLLLMASGLLALTGCSDDDTTAPEDPPDLAFEGSDACAQCHVEIHGNWQDSGHPYKLTKIDGVAPTDKFPTFSAFNSVDKTVIEPPAGYAWADISYTIGGYGWKMRWMDENGYIITQNDDTQYNFEDGSRVAYHPNDPIGTIEYDCGRCHTTGWVLSDDDVAENNQDGLPGLVGTFFAGGVHCEQCHGMGSRHAFDPEGFDMTVDTSAALCGQCHTRDAENHIAASGGFIQHHEQYDEWLHSPHNSVLGPDCNACHDPHSSVKFDSVAMGVGTSTSCEDCHTVQMKHNGFPTCIDCHMPKASKSAIAAIPDYVGDIRTHIFAINTDAVGKMEGMFDAAGTLVQEDVDGMAMVTLDFACYGCHRDDDGVGGIFSPKPLQELSDYVLGVGIYAGEGGIHSPVTRALASK